jgi:Bacterial Ig-like domain (group 3)
VFAVTNPTPTATRVSTTPSPAALNQPVQLVAVVVSPESSVTPTGTVTFYDGLTPLGSATLQYGVGTIYFTFTAKGRHSIVVRYTGDQYFAGNTSPALTVAIQ